MNERGNAMRETPVPGRRAAPPATALDPAAASARAEIPGGVVRVGAPADMSGGAARAPGRATGARRDARDPRGA